MNIKNGTLIALISLLALSQEGWAAEKVGSCLAPNDFFIKKDNLTYNMEPPRFFTKAEVSVASSSRSINCSYNSNRTIYMQIPELGMGGATRANISIYS